MNGNSERYLLDAGKAKTWLKLFAGLSDEVIFTQPKPSELKSVAQIEAELPASLRDQFNKEFVRKVPGATALAPLEDRRKAVAVTTAAQAFAGPAQQK